ncbi:C-type lectin domain family 17, member A-like [Macrobrachium nipponense]|uniref:C-type lectin domain family 17, member A-like n=1 Tax=Macrobrachium nipponense TaxID=159736 RepID=UPI0030C81F3D
MAGYPEDIGSPLTSFVSPVTGADGGYIPEAPQSRQRRQRRERERVRMPDIGLHPDPISTYATRDIQDESVAGYVPEENTACSDETELLSLQEENRFMVSAMKDKSSHITRYSKKMTKKQICIQDRRQKMSELTGESSRNCRLLQETRQQLGSVIAEMEGHGETCPSPFKTVGTACYYIVEEPHGWDEARVICQESGRSLGQDADLAIVATCDQHGKLWHHILINHNASLGFHLGGTDRGEEGFWYWLDATPIAMGVPFWRPGDPEGIGGQDCMGFYKDGYFIDRPCHVAVKSVCQLGVTGAI